MTALPNATTATASTATEGDVKNFLIGLRDYLNGLFGATGVPADARTALGVSPLTYANLVAALGFTPANTTHNHTGVYAPMTAFVAAGKIASNPGASYNQSIRFTRANGSTLDVISYETGS